MSSPALASEILTAQTPATPQVPPGPSDASAPRWFGLSWWQRS